MSASEDVEMQDVSDEEEEEDEIKSELGLNGLLIIHLSPLFS